MIKIKCTEKCYIWDLEKRNYNLLCAVSFFVVLLYNNIQLNTTELSFQLSVDFMEDIWKKKYFQYL